MSKSRIYTFYLSVLSAVSGGLAKSLEQSPASLGFLDGGRWFRFGADILSSLGGNILASFLYECFTNKRPTAEDIARNGQLQDAVARAIRGTIESETGKGMDHRAMRDLADAGEKYWPQAEEEALRDFEPEGLNDGFVKFFHEKQTVTAASEEQWRSYLEKAMHVAAKAVDDSCLERAAKALHERLSGYLATAIVMEVNNNPEAYRKLILRMLSELLALSRNNSGMLAEIQEGQRKLLQAFQAEAGPVIEALRAQSEWQMGEFEKIQGLLEGLAAANSVDVLSRGGRRAKKEAHRLVTQLSKKTERSVTEFESTARRFITEVERNKSSSDAAKDAASTARVLLAANAESNRQTRSLFTRTTWILGVASVVTLVVIVVVLEKARKLEAFAAPTLAKVKSVGEKVEQTAEAQDRMEKKAEVHQNRIEKKLDDVMSEILKKALLASQREPLGQQEEALPRFILASAKEQGLNAEETRDQLRVFSLKATETNDANAVALARIAGQVYQQLAEANQSGVEAFYRAQGGEGPKELLKMAAEKRSRWQWKEAIESYKLAAKTTSASKDPEGWAEIQIALAQTLNGAGHWREAEKTLRETLMVLENQKRHPQLRWRANRERAEALWYSGQCAAGEELLGEMRKKGEGDAAQNASVEWQLASFQRVRGLDTEAARQQLERMLPTLPAALREELRWQLRTELAWSALRQQNPKAALQHAEAANTTVPTEAHLQEPKHAGPMLALAHALAANGQLDEAAKAYESLIAMRTRTLGPTHPFLAETLAQYADLLQKKQEAGGAVAKANQAEAILAQSEWNEAMHAISILTHLSKAQLSPLLDPQYRWARAQRREMEESNRDLEMRFGKGGVPPGNPGPVPAALTKAEGLARKAATLSETALDLPHVAGISAYQQLGEVLAQKYDYTEDSQKPQVRTEAVETIRRAKDKACAFYGENDPKVIPYLERLANVPVNETGVLLKKIFTIRLQHDGEKSPVTAAAALECARWGTPEEKIEVLRRCLELCAAAGPAANELAVKATAKLAETLLEQPPKKEAEVQIRKALTLLGAAGKADTKLGDYCVEVSERVYAALYKNSYTAESKLEKSKYFIELYRATLGLDSTRLPKHSLILIQELFRGEQKKPYEQQNYAECYRLATETLKQALRAPSGVSAPRSELKDLFKQVAMYHQTVSKKGAEDPNIALLEIYREILGVGDTDTLDLMRQVAITLAGKSFPKDVMQAEKMMTEVAENYAKKGTTYSGLLEDTIKAYGRFVTKRLILQDPRDRSRDQNVELAAKKGGEEAAAKLRERLQ